MSRTLTERLRAPFQKGAGLRMYGMLGYDNNQPRRAQNAAGTGMVDLVGLDANNRLLLGASSTSFGRKPVVFALATNASLVTQRFFVAPGPMEIRAISVSYTTADGAANTAIVTKEVSGQAPGAGVSVMSNTFNMNSTASTTQWATLQSRDNPGFFGTGEPTISLNTGEMLSFKISSAVTSLAGVIITVWVIPNDTLPPAVYSFKANAGLATQYINLSNRYVTVAGVSMVWDTAATDAGAVTIDVTHETGTTASGSGNSILSAAQSVKGAPNVPVNPALTATASRLLLAPGDRLSVKYTGTLTALAGVVVVVDFSGISAAAGVSSPAGYTQAEFALTSNTSLGTNQAILGPVETDLQVVDASFVWGTAGSGTIDMTIDPSGTAAGGGTSIFSSAPATTGTANTVVVGTLSVSYRNLYLPAGGVLSVKFGGTKGSLANFVASALLIPA